MLVGCLWLMIHFKQFATFIAIKLPCFHNGRITINRSTINNLNLSLGDFYPYSHNQFPNQVNVLIAPFAIALAALTIKPHATMISRASKPKKK